MPPCREGGLNIYVHGSQSTRHCSQSVRRYSQSARSTVLASSRAVLASPEAVIVSPHTIVASPHAVVATLHANVATLLDNYIFSEATEIASQFSLLQSPSYSRCYSSSRSSVQPPGGCLTGTPDTAPHWATTSQIVDRGYG